MKRVRCVIPQYNFVDEDLIFFVSAYQDMMKSFRDNLARTFIFYDVFPHFLDIEADLNDNSSCQAVWDEAVAFFSTLVKYVAACKSFVVNNESLLVDFAKQVGDPTLTHIGNSQMRTIANHIESDILLKLSRTAYTNQTAVSYTHLTLPTTPYV